LRRVYQKHLSKRETDKKKSTNPLPVYFDSVFQYIIFQTILYGRTPAKTRSKKNYRSYKTNALRHKMEERS